MIQKRWGKAWINYAVKSINILNINHFPKGLWLKVSPFMAKTILGPRMLGKLGVFTTQRNSLFFILMSSKQLKTNLKKLKTSKKMKVIKKRMVGATFLTNSFGGINSKSLLLSWAPFSTLSLILGQISTFQFQINQNTVHTHSIYNNQGQKASWAHIIINSLVK